MLARKLVHALMSLFATLVAIAALFLLLGSEFLAAMQLFVYGGAVTVLVLFVLMLSGEAAEAEARLAPLGRAGWRGVVCVAFFALLACTIGCGGVAARPSRADRHRGDRDDPVLEVRPAVRDRRPRADHRAHRRDRAGARGRRARRRRGRRGR